MYNARFVRQFSEIEGLQKASMLSYTAAPSPDGVVLCVREDSADGAKTESCLCPDLSVSSACDLLQFACENNFGPGTWLDLLTDHSIRYEMRATV